jgi:hypothetical protein
MAKTVAMASAPTASEENARRLSEVDARLAEAGAVQGTAQAQVRALQTIVNPNIQPDGAATPSRVTFWQAQRDLPAAQVALAEAELRLDALRRERADLRAAQVEHLRAEHAHDLRPLVTELDRHLGAAAAVCDRMAEASVRFHEAAGEFFDAAYWPDLIADAPDGSRTSRLTMWREAMRTQGLLS